MSFSSSALHARCLFIVVIVSGAGALMPALLNEHQRERQERTAGNMLELASALESYRRQQGQLPEADSVEQLRAPLAPRFISRIPTRDGWDRPLKYEWWEGDGERRVRFALASAGSDGEWEHASLRDYDATPFGPSAFGEDIVYRDGSFTRRPVIVPRSILREYGGAILIVGGYFSWLLFIFVSDLMSDYRRRKWKDRS